MNLEKFRNHGMSIERLRCIYYVYLTRSTTEAGQMMGLSQSAVSHQIKIAEEALGVTLFVRVDRGMHPTPEGEDTAQLAQHILYEVDAMCKNSKAKKEGLRGEMHILTFPSFASITLTATLKSFREKYPAIILSVSTPNIYLSPLEADVVISHYIPKNPHLKQFRLHDQVIGLYAHKDYLEKHGTPQSVEELEHYNLLGVNLELEKNYPLANWILKTGIQSGHTQRDAVLYLENNASVSKMMLEGVGIAGLNHSHAKALGPDIVRVLPDRQSESTPLYFLFNGNIQNTEKYMALYNHLKDYLEPFESKE